MASERRRRFGWGLGLLVVAVLAAVAVWMFAGPNPPPPAASITTQAASQGLVAYSPPASTSLRRPGSQTLAPAGTDSRDNGGPQAGRAAPSEASS